MDNAALEGGSDEQDRTGSSSSSSQDDQENSELVWAFDKLKDIDKDHVGHYVQFAATACIPGGGCDIEQALDVLYKCKGDIMHATSQLLSRETDGQTIWTSNEKQSFEEAFSKYPKNFCSISRELKTKSVKDCVRYYYLWKKSPYRSSQTTPKSDTSSNSSNSSNSNSSILPEINNNNNNNSNPNDPSNHYDLFFKVFPCKVCGREFAKIKSRSAHMKRHKNEKLYG